MTDNLVEKYASELNNEDLVERIRQDFQASRDHTATWREEAREDFEFIAGKQWSDSDMQLLKEQMRPVVTFNRSEVFISAVTGLEALNRQEVKFLPRAAGMVNGVKAQYWSAAADYVNEDTYAEFHHSHAFRDMVICGVGVSLTRLDFDTNPDVRIAIERLNPLNYYWDPRSTQRNHADAGWVLYVEPWRFRDIKAVFGRAKAEELADHEFFDPVRAQTTPHDATNAWQYDGPPKPNQDSDIVYVARYQWWELKSLVKVEANGRSKTMTAEQWDDAIDADPTIAGMVQMTKTRVRQYHQVLLAGKTILEHTELSSPEFSIQAMTGKYDQQAGTWFGLTRSLKDPQCWLNKLYSSLLYMVSSNAKGGILAERNAFDNPQEAERTWARPDRITWASDGAITQGRIMPKPPLEYPSGMDRLMQVALEMFPGVTGANIELLGLAEKVQPGVLEAQRKQAGMTILAWAFDAMRHYRKRHGKVLASYISKYIADGRLIRVTDPNGNPQYINLLRDELALEYDVIVDESPNNPNERERTFAVLMQLLPVLTKNGTASMPPQVYDYLPIPASLAEEFRKAAQPDPQQLQMQQLLQQLQAKGAQAKVAETESKAVLNTAKAQAEAANINLEGQKAATEAAKAQHEMLIDLLQ